MKAERQEVFTRNHETSHARPLQRPSMDYSRLGPYPSVLLLALHPFSLRPVLRFLRSISAPCVLAPYILGFLPSILRSLQLVLKSACVLSSAPYVLLSTPCTVSFTSCVLSSAPREP